MSKYHKALIIIPARGGSKGIKDKNIYPLNDKPLIYYTINAAKNSKLCGNLIVSTDSENISNTAKSFGAEVIKRPSHLSSDFSKSEDALLHVLNTLKKNKIPIQEWTIFIQCTSPLILSEDIDKAMDIAITNSYDSVFSVYKYHFAGLWEKKKNNILPLNYDPYDRPMRQEKNNIFVENGALYLIKSNLLLQTKNRFSNNCGIHIMPFERSLQVDTLDDIKLIERVI